MDTDEINKDDLLQYYDNFVSPEPDFSHQMIRMTNIMNFTRYLKQTKKIQMTDGHLSKIDADAV